MVKESLRCGLDDQVKNDFVFISTESTPVACRVVNYSTKDNQVGHRRTCSECPEVEQSGTANWQFQRSKTMPLSRRHVRVRERETWDSLNRQICRMGQSQKKTQMIYDVCCYPRTAECIRYNFCESNISEFLRA